MTIELPTGQWYAPTAVIHDAWYCMVFHGIPWYCMILHGPALYCIVWHGIAQYCTVLHGIAWYCTVLHGIAWYCMVLHDIAWYCMDIAVVAQKVKVHNEDQCDLKKWGCWVTSRSGWLLELLTELTMRYNSDLLNIKLKAGNFDWGQPMYVVIYMRSSIKMLNNTRFNYSNHPPWLLRTFHHPETKVVWEVIMNRGGDRKTAPPQNTTWWWCVMCDLIDHWSMQPTCTRCVVVDCCATSRWTAKFFALRQTSSVFLSSVGTFAVQKNLVRCVPL